jgi:hypothetical protein
MARNNTGSYARYPLAEVGEEADLHTFLPIFDAVDTQLTYAHTKWGA